MTSLTSQHNKSRKLVANIGFPFVQKANTVAFKMSCKVQGVQSSASGPVPDFFISIKGRLLNHGIRQFLLVPFIINGGMLSCTGQRGLLGKVNIKLRVAPAF